MVAKLKLVLQTPYLPLILNTIFFGVLLSWFVFGNHGFFALLFFVCITWYLYAQSSFAHTRLWQFFLVLLALVLAIPVLIPQYIWFLLPLCIVSWAILAGLERLLFVDRSFFVYVLGVILLLVAVLLYISIDERMGVHGFFNAAAFITVIALLFDGILTIVYDSIRRRHALSLVGALLLFQLVWALSLLPFGVFTILVLGFLFGASYVDFFVRIERASVNPLALFSHTLIFIVFIVLVSLTTHWRL